MASSHTRRIGMGASIAALALFAALPASAANLLEVYKEARRDAPRFAAAQAEYQAAREALPQAWAPALPQVSLRGSIEQGERSRPLGGTASFDSQELTLSISQTLFNWTQFANIDRAQAKVAQAKAELASAKQRLITRVASAYFEILAAADNLRFALAEKRAIRRQLEQARERFEVGLIAITAVKAAQAAYDLAVSRVISARNRLKTAREALRAITGEIPDELATLSDNLPLAKPEPTDPSAWVERAFDHNPGLLAARAGVKAAREAIAAARGGRFPDVELFARVSQRDVDFDGGTALSEDETTIGIQMTWPLYSGGGIFSKVDEAQARFQASQARVVEARRSARQNTLDAYRGVLASISLVKALRQAVESNRAAVEAVRAGFDVGTRTAVDVLEALRDLYEAQRDYADARYDYVLNRLQLKRAAGTLAIDDIRLVNTWLRPVDPT